jgi:bla regulator protein BlaR1
MGHYILQTIAFQLFFLIIYDAFLKKETFFNWNRAYLLVTALLSIALPFIKIQSFKNVVPKNFVMAMPEITLGNISVVDPTLATQIITTEASKFQFSWELLFYVGAFVTLSMFMFKLIKIITLIYKNPKYWSHNLRIVTLLKSNTAFSFFYYVFLGEQIKEEDKPTILKHEAIHVNQKHTLDLLFFELLRIVFWFNPLIYMYQNRIASLHEFIADAEAVKSRNKNDYYQDLLSQIFETENVSFINAFYKKSLIKKRIVMLSKAKSKQTQLVKSK